LGGGGHERFEGRLDGGVEGGIGAELVGDEVGVGREPEVVYLFDGWVRIHGCCWTEVLGEWAELSKVGSEERLVLESLVMRSVIVVAW
jgi:hypothetical protein